MSDVQARIAEDVKNNDVLLYMKGTPVFPQCGFSAVTVQILSHLGVKFKAVDVLADPEVREGIKDFSNWPTIPQLYVKGEFVGGADILREMFEEEELVPFLAERGVALEPRLTCLGRSDEVGACCRMNFGRQILARSKCRCQTGAIAGRSDTAAASAVRRGRLLLPPFRAHAPAREHRGIDIQQRKAARQQDTAPPAPARSAAGVRAPGRAPLRAAHRRLRLPARSARDNPRSRQRDRSRSP